MKEEETKLFYDRYHDMVFRIAFLFFKNEADACDIVQEVFFRLIKEKKTFKDEQHVKAWLIKVTTNQSKSILRSFWRKKRTDERQLNNYTVNQETFSTLMYALMKLPDDARILLYMHYYEGYQLDEIAKIMQKNASTVRSKVVRARNLLRKELEKEEYICSHSMNEN